MPELPEVETVCRGLSAALKGAKILSARTRSKGLRSPFPERLGDRLRGGTIQSFSRRAKYILMALDGDDTIILHLGMSGRLIVEPDDPRDPDKNLSRHDHLVLHCDKDRRLRFHDPRRFGICDLAANQSLPQHKSLRDLGIEPFDAAFNADFLAKAWKGKSASVKETLMDQRIVVGIGNIYACEALYRAGIDPRRKAGTCGKAQCAKLVEAVRAVLTEAIASGGSSLRDYRHADGGEGWFQHSFAVYGRVGEPCPDCDCEVIKTGGIQRIRQGGRSTFLCSEKQK
ncbi:MAG: bifunctional DNA-formamidopyrimidine glycosylase/DNA-(apurinic or apyrimidinic site) lyase [Bdellovibrionales bacterium]